METTTQENQEQKIKINVVGTEIDTLKTASIFLNPEYEISINEYIGIKIKIQVILYRNTLNGKWLMDCWETMDYKFSYNGAEIKDKEKEKHFIELNKLAGIELWSLIDLYLESQIINTDWNLYCEKAGIQVHSRIELR